MYQALSVLNPFQKTDAAIMNDTDLAGPLLFCLLFGTILLLVSGSSFYGKSCRFIVIIQSGKVHFGYIYGVGLLGCSSMYVVLNLMSTSGVSVGCVVSILGYCLLPMSMLSTFSVIVHLQ